MHEYKQFARANIIAPSLRGFGNSTYNNKITSYKDLA